METANESACTADMTAKEPRALRLVRRYMWWSAGVGLVPIPIVDVAALTAVQLKMLADLSNHYELEFRRSLAKSIVGSLIGSVSSAALAYGGIGSFLKGIPGPGSLLGMLSMPGFSAAITWAVGKVFIQHFESGGTFLDFEPAKVRDFFQQEFEVGKEEASKMKEDSSKN